MAPSGVDLFLDFVGALWRSVARALAAFGGLAASDASQALPPPQPHFVVWDAVADASGDVVVAHRLGVFRGRLGQPWQRELVEPMGAGRLFMGGGAQWLQADTGLWRFDAGRWQRVDAAQAAGAFQVLAVDDQARLWVCGSEGQVKHSTDALTWVAVAPPAAGDACRQERDRHFRIAQGASVVTVRFASGWFQTTDAGRRWAAVPQDAAMAAAGYTDLATVATSRGHLLAYFFSSDRGDALRQWAPGATQWTTVAGGGDAGWAGWSKPLGVVGERVFVGRLHRSEGWQTVELRAEGAVAAVLPQVNAMGGVFAHGDAVYAFDLYGVSRFSPPLGRFESWAELPDPYTGDGPDGPSAAGRAAATRFRTASPPAAPTP